MKISEASSRSLRWANLSGLALAGVLSGPAMVAAEPAPAAAKTFVLFMGADIDVQIGKESHRVKNVAGDSFVITVDQKPVEVPMNRGPINMKVTPQLKLSDKTAVVKDLKFERAYTPDNDPNKKWASSQSGSAAQAAIGTNAGLMASAQMGAGLAAQRGAALAGPSGTTFGNDGAVAATTTNFNSAVSAGNSDQNSAGYATQQLQEELDKQLFDAVRVTCEISSPKPMRDPYMVIITQYREKDDPPGAVKNWVFARQLDRLDENPVTVRFLKGGFPKGFEMVKQQLHLYGAGRELGTNVADKNVALTRDDAHQYIVIDHLTTHKGATLAASVALGVSYKDFSPHFPSVQLQQEIFVKVDKDGLPGGVFRNEACSESTGDTYLESLVGNVRFKPALKAGKAVDSVAKLKIADLAI